MCCNTHHYFLQTLKNFLFGEAFCLTIHYSGFLPSFPLYVFWVGFCKTTRIYFGWGAVLFLQEEVRGCALSPAPKLLDQTGSSVSQAPGRLLSSDGTTKQLLLFTMGQVGNYS